MSEHPTPGDGFWYMGGPYSVDIHNKYNDHLRSAYLLTKTDLTIYSPIVMFHIMAQKYTMPTDADFWMKHNYGMLSGANGMILLQLPNWRESKGVQKEAFYCQMKNKPVWGLKPPEDTIFEWTRLF